MHKPITDENQLNAASRKVPALAWGLLRETSSHGWQLVCSVESDSTNGGSLGMWDLTPFRGVAVLQASDIGADSVPRLSPVASKGSADAVYMVAMLLPTHSLP